MGRKAQFEKIDIINAALCIIGNRGPGSATIPAIVEQLNCPVGSIYHRYDSLQHILADTWLSIVESFQEGFLQCLNNENPHEGGLNAALYTPGWSRKNFHEARVLLCYRREDLVSDEWPMPVRERAEFAGDRLLKGMQNYIKKRFSRATKRDHELVRFVLINMPKAAVSHYLESGNRIEGFVDDFIKDSYMALLEK